MLEKIKKELRTKTENNEKFWWFTGIGWMNEHQLESHIPEIIETKKYKEFMSNPENEFNCCECPHNNRENTIDKYPCGQQNCWVTCHFQE